MIQKRALGPWLVIAGSIFNVSLCFVSTRHWAAIGSAEVTVIELAILSAGAFFIRGRLTNEFLQVGFLLATYMIALKLINPDADLKILPDIAIMYIFYKLGTLSSVEIGHRTLWAIMLIVLSLGLFELLDLKAFGKVFDVWSYYVDKGGIAQDVVNYGNTTSFVSASRGDAEMRTFLPGILGAHRVSSIFLEPVSMGNFSVITMAWCLSTTVGTPRSRALLMACAVFCSVLADSRFGGACCVLLLMVRLASLRSDLFAFLLPILVLMALVVVGTLNGMPGDATPSIMTDNFSGRLLFSARLLAGWDPGQWLGWTASNVYTADTGYAYLINGIGLPFTLLLLFLFAANRCETEEAVRMKIMISIYFAAALSIGASVFTIKTGALLWFLYGTTNAVASTAQTRLRPVRRPQEGRPHTIMPMVNRNA
ncbi:MAG TPA: polysaccharide polymerase [Acidocella sp.]|jgi:putative polymerase|nr:polysaccharide polymerase [Acidocella sp.]